MTFNDLLIGHSEPLQKILKNLQKLILKLNPAIEEDIYGGAKVQMASYSIGRKDNVIAVTGIGKDHVKLFLHHTHKIDAKGLKLEGKGKHAKHVKIYALDEKDFDILLAVIDQVHEIVASKA